MALTLTPWRYAFSLWRLWLSHRFHVFYQRTPLTACSYWWGKAIMAMIAKPFYPANLDINLNDDLIHEITILSCPQDIYLICEGGNSWKWSTGDPLVHFWKGATHSTRMGRTYAWNSVSIISAFCLPCACLYHDCKSSLFFCLAHFCPHFKITSNRNVSMAPSLTN